MSEKDSKFPVETDGQLYTRMRPRLVSDTIALAEAETEEVESEIVTGTVKASKSDPFFEPGEHNYKMTSSPRGIALVINNMDFNEGPTKNDLMRARTGSDVDSFRIERLFERLNFVVLRHRNLKASEMLKVIKRFSKKSEHKEMDSALVFIMSHGSSGDIVFGSDAEPVNYNAILNMFNNNDCKNLVGKPKMFFFQACRGDNIDLGVVHKGTHNDAHPLEESKSYEDESKLPSRSDILVASSTIPGNTSYRNQATGSWFVEIIFKVFAESACNRHLVDMLTEVANELSKRQTEDGEKQGPETILQSWRKNLYFNPGHFKL
ncbi:Caspase-2 [Nymphon striatum]|nr:Caspase-2 [Nymphon striatum]